MGIRETKYYVARCNQCFTEVSSKLGCDIFTFWVSLEQLGWNVKSTWEHALTFCPRCTPDSDPSEKDTDQ